MTVSHERVESNQCSLGSGLEVRAVVGKVLGGGSVKGGGVGVTEGERDRRLMDWAREDNWDEMVDWSMGVG